MWPWLAFIASASVGLGSKLEEQDFQPFACTKNGARAKKRGRGRKEMLADKPLDFENLCSPVNIARVWLG